MSERLRAGWFSELQEAPELRSSNNVWRIDICVARSVFV